VEPMGQSTPVFPFPFPFPIYQKDQLKQKKNMYFKDPIAQKNSEIRSNKLEKLGAYGDYTLSLLFSRVGRN